MPIMVMHQVRNFVDHDAIGDNFTMFNERYLWKLKIKKKKFIF